MMRNTRVFHIVRMLSIVRVLCNTRVLSENWLL